MTAETLAEAKGILFDLNGVFYVDDELIEGACEAIEHARAKGRPCRFTTNTTTRSLDALHGRLRDMGLPIAREEIISPSKAAVLYLRTLGKPKCHLLVNEDTKKDFAEFAVSHTNPDVIVIGDIDDRWNYKIMNQAFQMLMYGARLIALHRGKFWQAAGELRLDIGAFVAGLEYVSGREATVIGKPALSFFQMSLSDMGLEPGEAVMLGDDIEMDVGGAQAAGLKGVLVKTGKYRPELAARSNVQPDGVLETIAELREYL